MFLEAGPADFSGMGASQLTFAEIAAWCQLRDMRLSPWEVGMIRSLSRVYCQVTAERSKSD